MPVARTTIRAKNVRGPFSGLTAWESWQEPGTLLLSTHGSSTGSYDKREVRKLRDTLNDFLGERPQGTEDRSIGKTVTTLTDPNWRAGTVSATGSEYSREARVDVQTSTYGDGKVFVHTYAPGKADGGGFGVHLTPDEVRKLRKALGEFLPVDPQFKVDLSKIDFGPPPSEDWFRRLQEDIRRMPVPLVPTPPAPPVIERIVIEQRPTVGIAPPSIKRVVALDKDDDEVATLPVTGYNIEQRQQGAIQGDPSGYKAILGFHGFRVTVKDVT